MSVLIKSMEMPKNCSACPMCDRLDWLCHAASRWLDDDEYWTWYVYPEGDTDDSKPMNCPLIEIPSHGRLIDADAMKDKMLEYFGDSTRLCEEIRALFCTASTIIESESE